MKSVVAFANGTGGKIIFGIADKTREVVGFGKEDVFKKMDAIANAVSDSCEPAIKLDNVHAAAIKEYLDLLDLTWEIDVLHLPDFRDQTQRGGCPD